MLCYYVVAVIVLVVVVVEVIVLVRDLAVVAVEEVEVGQVVK